VAPGGARSGDRDRLRLLADLVPILESPSADFGHWETPPGTLGYYVFGPAGEAFLDAVGRGGWVVAGFDSRTWLTTPEGESLRDRPDAVADASIDQLAWLLTAIVRSDRFVEGSIEGAFESGLLGWVAQRAAALLAAEEPSDDDSPPAPY
jgi:hypothetical protein